MEDPTTTRYPGFDLRTREGRLVIAYGVWLRVAIIGAVAAMAGVAQMLSGGAVALSALALAAGGAAVAYGGWRRACAALDSIDSPPGVPAAPARLEVPAAAGGQRA
ncbi:MAG: hypothetical protein IT517_09895 [Burkholderiales bacterium]|nr:hypothetical protein [Burkholderiales bacterium]